MMNTHRNNRSMTAATARRGRLEMLALSALVATTALVAAASAPAAAATVVALVGDDRLAMVDPSSRAVSEPVAIDGVGGRVLGIDVRPADGMLYALFADGTLAVVDPATGKAQAKSKLSTMLPDGVMATVDFNPAADRLRVIGSDGTNLRVNVDDGKVTTDGKLTFAATDMHKGEAPMIAAGAYSNSVKGTKETALYDIDVAIGALVKQAPPNDGVLNAVGKLGVMPKSVAFDIVADGNGGNTAWMVADGRLYTVDLATGKATEAGALSGVETEVRDIAITP
jgi:DNA-binding beta-propeller fold protein YncE